MVLHITIQASGFAPGAFEEPVAGLIIVVVLKIGFDIYHWKNDEAGEAGDTKDALVLTPKNSNKCTSNLPK